MQYCIRDASKAAGIWDTAPMVEDISTAKMNVFYSKVVHVYTVLLMYLRPHRINCLFELTWPFKTRVGRSAVNL